MSASSLGSSRTAAPCCVARRQGNRTASPIQQVVEPLDRVLEQAEIIEVYVEEGTHTRSALADFSSLAAAGADFAFLGFFDFGRGGYSTVLSPMIYLA